MVIRQTLSHSPRGHKHSSPQQPGSERLEKPRAWEGDVWHQGTAEKRAMACGRWPDRRHGRAGVQGRFRPRRGSPPARPTARRRLQFVEFIVAPHRCPLPHAPTPDPHSLRDRATPPGAALGSAWQRFALPTPPRSCVASESWRPRHAPRSSSLPSAQKRCSSSASPGGSTTGSRSVAPPSVPREILDNFRADEPR